MMTSCFRFMHFSTFRYFSTEKPSKVFLPKINIDTLNWHPESSIPKEIPLLDLSNTSHQEKIKSFQRASELSHCLYLKNHGISDKEVEDLVNITRTFFNDSEEKKSKASHPYKGMLRGYIGLGKESSSNVFDIDNKGYGDANITYWWGPADNIYQDLAFKKIWRRYYRKSFKLAKAIALLAIESLGLESSMKMNRLYGTDNLLKINEYLEPTQQTYQPFWIVPHADASFLTLLTQLPAENGNIGLQFMVGDRAIDAPAVKGTTVLNFGEPMASVSKGKIKPAVHQVINPGEKFAGSSRTSIPFFLHPRPNLSIERYEGTTYGHFYNKEGPTKYKDFFERLVKGIHGK